MTQRITMAMCVTAPSPSLVCPICQEVFLEPVITSQCFHTFCSSCIAKSMQFEPQCPLCRKKLRVEDIHSNLALQGLVAELMVFCPFKADGCNESIRYETLNNHITSQCLFVPKKCVYADYGCDFSGVGMTLQNHLDNGCAYHKLRAFIKLTDQRISHLETIVMEQQQLVSSLISGKVLKSSDSLDLLSSHVTGSGNGANGGGSSSVEVASVNSQDMRVAQHNWLESGMTCTKTLNTERSGVTSLAYNGGGVLYAGSYDGSIKIYDSYTNRMMRSLIGHRLSVWALALDAGRNRLYSGCSDETINVWNTDQEGSSCIATFGANHGKVYSLLTKDNRIYSASSDQTIRIWNADNFEHIGTLSGHSGGVNSIKFHNDRLISASSDKSIKIWDLSTSTCVNTIQEHTSEILDITTGQNILFASGYDANISAYNLNDLGRLASMPGHRWEVWQLEYSNQVLFSGSHDHTLKIWDIRNFQNASTLIGHKGYIHALIWGEGGELLSGCADRTIKIWS